MEDVCEGVIDATKDLKDGVSGAKKSMSGLFGSVAAEAEKYEDTISDAVKMTSKLDDITGDV